MEALTRRRVQIGTLAASAVGVLLFMYLLRSVFNPFLLALALAYIFNPVINWMESRRVPRKSAVVLIFMLLAVTFVAVTLLVVPVIIGEAHDWSITVLGEEYRDVNNNGVYDAISEKDTWKDTNGNGRYDGPEPFTDKNGNGIYDARSEWNSWRDSNGNGTYDEGEEYEDLNGNGEFDLDIPADSYSDLNANGEFDRQGEPYRDLNNNGKYDPDIGPDVPLDDVNNNGRYDPGYIYKLTAMLTKYEDEGDGENGIAAALEGFIPRERWERMVADAMNELRKNISSVATATKDVLGAAVRRGWEAAGWVSSLLFFLVLTPIYMGFLLYGMESGWNRFTSYIPAAIKPRFLDIAHKTDLVIGAFFRGRLLVCLAIGTFTSIGFVICGLRFGLLFGMVIGIASFIPFLNIVPLIVALLVGWMDGMGLSMLLVSLTVYALGQGLDPLLMTLVVGRDLHLHPVTILLSMFICTALLGFFGMLLAVPIVAVGKILFREFALPHLQELATEEANP